MLSKAINRAEGIPVSALYPEDPAWPEARAALGDMPNPLGQMKL